MSTENKGPYRYTSEQGMYRIIGPKLHEPLCINYRDLATASTEVYRLNAAFAAGQATREKDPWIKVETALPEDNHFPVMVKADTGFGHYQYFAAFLGTDDNEPTYWIMDLPHGTEFDVRIPNVIAWRPLHEVPPTTDTDNAPSSYGG